MPEAESKNPLESLSQKLIEEHWEFYPTAGSRIGRHEYDGRLPDLSPASLRRQVSELNAGLEQLKAIDVGAAQSKERLSHQMLEHFLRRELFTFNEMKPLENNPMRQTAFLNVGGYIRRDYAPITDRVRSATQVLAQVPDFLGVLDAALEQEIGPPVLEMSIESYSGMARFYREDLPKALADFGDAELDHSTVSQFNLAREKAAVAVDRFVAAMESRLAKTQGDFAIGSTLYSSMLATGEGVDLPLAEITRVGQANLDANLEQVKELAQRLSIEQGKALEQGKAPEQGSASGSVNVSEIVADIGSRHPTAEALIPATRNMLEDLRQVLIDLDIITVPSDDRCLVMETPTDMRYAFAAMDSAGAMETRATESFYYVTPVEPEWPAAQQEEWLSNFNYDTLRIISIHEVFPGHFVHHLHNRYGIGLPLVNRAATSYAFTEGWAHYAEQMMMETEYAKDKTALQLTQVLEALVRNCRYMCSIWMHTQGMSVEDATRFFMDNAYMGELPARREALRGTFDPGYLNYTLGKLMIIKLAQDYRREQASAFSLKGFHDRLLSYGAPPLPLVREQMLNEPGSSPL